MKRFICLLISLTVFLCGCNRQPDQSPAPNATENSTTTSGQSGATISTESAFLSTSGTDFVTSSISTSVTTSTSDNSGSNKDESSTTSNTDALPSTGSQSAQLSTTPTQSTLISSTTTGLGSSSNTQSTTDRSDSSVSLSSTKTSTTISKITITTTIVSGKDCVHVDTDNNGQCDRCAVSVVVIFDFYSINDLHGKFADTTSQPGVDELTTYLKNARNDNKNSVFLSAGDMWQGSAESNMTKGNILTDWMNELGFAGMAIGNHEFDWGEEFIDANAKIAEFPLLAINIYDRDTNALSEFCSPSIMVEGDGIQIGIIGAIGDCYSSIAVDKCDEVYFKVGYELTQLVKAESQRLRDAGADFIVYLLHDGYGQSQNGSIIGAQLSSYYDVSLSNGYVDLVFEGHTHQGYRFQDKHGVYHIQNRGDNNGGISHAEVAINTANDTHTVRVAEHISTSTYQHLPDDPIVESLLEKYKEQISPANRILGYNSRYRSSTELQQKIAQLYYEAGMREWGGQYNIVLGGGFMSARSPYNLYTGEVTYAQLQTIFPFDNQLTLCSIKGRYLRSKFLETNNDRYYIYCGEYGNSIRNQIDPNATYYLITDSYSAYYGPNKLTVIAEYDPDVFGRDLLAEYIEAGGFSD